MTEEDYEYDVGLSFADEQREYVEQVADELKSRGIRPFYDDYETGKMWGKDLYAYLSDIYQYTCRYCVIFVSKEYASKVWTNQERKSAQARALQEKREYILPARFDDTPIEGLPDTVGYVNLTDMSPQQLADLIQEKLGQPTRRQYLPPTLDRLFERLDISDDSDLQEIAYRHAHFFLRALTRMSDEERRAVTVAIRYGCPTELPDNIHINSDLLRRLTGESEPRLARLLSGTKSLGFSCTTREDEEHPAEIMGVELRGSDFFCLGWLNLNSNPEEEDQLPALLVARTMIKVATENYCEEHGTEFLDRLDFSQLASATVSRELSGI